MKWTNIKQIAEALEENYPEAEVETLSHNKIHKMVISLLDFDDHAADSSENLLEAIQEQWLELRGY